MALTSDRPIVTVHAVELHRVSRETGKDTGDTYYVNAAHIVYWKPCQLFTQNAGRALVTQVLLSNGRELYVSEDSRLIWRMVDPS